MKSEALRVQGLYVITGAYRDVPDLSRQVRAALHGGARTVQYRDKNQNAATRLEAARAVVAVCHEFGARFIVNDDVALAAASGADGVHLGRDDAGAKAARAALGAGALIGVSCYNEFERAVAAQAQGADYIAFGSFYASTTKPNAVRADVALLSRARAALKINIVAIGGVTASNARALIEAGADAVAVCDDVFGRADIESAARAYAHLFTR